jgi:hypothetical protein
MNEQINLVKEVYGRNTYPRVIDINFSELYLPVTSSGITETVTVEAFFDAYNELFFQIPATGEINSHEYLVARSTEYLGGVTLTDSEKAYIEEINSLRQQLLEANSNYSNLTKIL